MGRSSFLLLWLTILCCLFSVFGQKEKVDDSVVDNNIFARLYANKGRFHHGFFASLSVIIVSELGDKTFFIAAIMAMRHSRSVVLAGALGALALMTALSAAVGHATYLIPRAYTFYGSSMLFLLFGMKMLKEAYQMSPDEGQEEYEDVQSELKMKDVEEGKDSFPSVKTRNFPVVVLKRIFSPIFLQAFTLTFLAEWGDRSQLATIILAAREDAVAVTIGGILGHAFCTGLAVLGGRFIAQRISVRTVTFVGALVFILFGLSAFYVGP